MSRLDILEGIRQEKNEPSIAARSMIDGSFGVEISALQGETIAVPADDTVRHVVDLFVATLREQLCHGFRA